MRTRTQLFLSALPLLAAGCQTPQAAKRQQLVLFPQPPAEPRIQFLTSLRGADDIVGPKSSFSQFIPGAECLPEGWNWHSIDVRLRKSGSSLSRFLAERGVAEAKEEFSLEMVERCARAYKEKRGKVPSQVSGTECLPEGWTWAAINQRLRERLPRFLAERGLAKEEFSLEMVERCARAYKKKRGKAPSQGSGAECLPEGWTWAAINARLSGGLPRFLAERGLAKRKGGRSQRSSI